MAEEIAQVSEIFLNDPNSPYDVAPSGVTVEMYTGLSGDRGSYIIPGLGNPNTYNFQESYILSADGSRAYFEPQPFDLFINLKSTDPTYLTTFQLDANGQVWSKVFKVTPNVFNANSVETFVSGVLFKSLTVSKESLPIEQLFGDNAQQNNFDVFRIPLNSEVVETADSESAMLALSGLNVGDYAYRTDISRFFRLVSSDASLIGSWQAELSVNVAIDIESLTGDTPYPTMIGFSTDAPYDDGDNYVFPISILAYEATGASLLDIAPINNDKIIHLSVSVI